MGHSYKILYLLRPFIWFLVAGLVATFGNLFLKRLLNGVAIFLFILGIGGVYLMTGMIQQVMDPFYFATVEEYMNCIVGSVTTVVFLVGAIGYFLTASVVKTEEGKESKYAQLKQKIAGYLMALLLPFAIMGYTLPFFLLDSIIAKCIGVIGQIGGIALAIVIIRRFNKKEDVTKE